LKRPFWRFFVNTAEDQFRRLVHHQTEGAQVFYAAPRFSDWTEYEKAFHKGKVLNRSLLITPLEIRRGTLGVLGPHRVVYDGRKRYVCSAPVPIDEVEPEQFVEQVGASARSPVFSLESRLERLQSPSDAEGLLRRVPQTERARIESRAESHAHALAAIIGLEAWLQGAQTLFVTPS
jgi:hypothetical protein